MSSSELIEQLQLAVRSGRQVEAVVTACNYACCGGRWMVRTDYEQTYQGAIKHVWPDGSFLLHAIAVSSLNYAVIAEIRHLEAIRFLD